MKRQVKLWQLMGFAVTSLAGTLLHFLYDWLERARWVAPFSGVNESTWEHMKILFWPMFIYSIVQSVFFRDRIDFWCIKLRGILFGLILIPVIFYTYNGVVGKSPDWINIAIFFLSAAVAYIYETDRFKKSQPTYSNSKASFAALCAIAALFVIFSFYPPRINLFKDPLSDTYGII